jgi:magnesium-transporting ATPase (P-type)
MAAHPRFVYANQPALNEGFCDNRSDTAKYNLVSFVPLFLLENFSRFANAYFLAVGLLQMVPEITITDGLPSMLVPLAFVLLFDAVITAREDLMRHADDWRDNNRMVHVARPEARAKRGAFVELPWQALRVGDVIRVERGDEIPADCILLGSHTEGGAVPSDAAYVQTAQLDGETNLKVRRAPPMPRPFQVTSDRRALRFRGAVLCDPPTASFSSFNGVVEPHPSLFGAKRGSPLRGSVRPGARKQTPGRKRRRGMSNRSIDSYHDLPANGAAAAMGGHPVMHDSEEDTDLEDDPQPAYCERCAEQCARTDWRGWCSVLCGAMIARCSLAVLTAIGRCLGCRPPVRSPATAWHQPCPSDPEHVAVEAACLLLRGAELRSVDVAWALVIYTGQETKVRVAQQKASFKRPTSEGALNRGMAVLATLLVAVCIASTAAWVGWTLTPTDATFRHEVLLDPPGGIAVIDAVSMAGTQFLLQAGLIPVSLYVSVRLARTVSAARLESNQDLLPWSDRRSLLSEPPRGCCCARGPAAAPTARFARVRTMDLLDELGQVTHVFSDKTGTLTRNLMILRQLWAGGVTYGMPSAHAGKMKAASEAEAHEPPLYPFDGSDDEEDDSPSDDGVTVGTCVSGPNVHYVDGSTSHPGRFLSTDSVSAGSCLASKVLLHGGALPEDADEETVASVQARMLLLNMALNHSVLIEPELSIVGEAEKDEDDDDDDEVGPRSSSSRGKRPKRVWKGYSLSASSPDEASFVHAAARMGAVFLARKGRWIVLEELGPSTTAGSEWLQAAAKRGQELLSMVRPLEIDDSVPRTPVGVHDRVLLETRDVRVLSRDGAYADSTTPSLWSHLTLWEVVHTLPYNQHRKRMSVLVRGPLGRDAEPRWLLLCKGADSVVLPRLLKAPDDPLSRESRLRNRLERQLRRWGSVGLRTLCFGGKRLKASAGADWARHFAAAWADFGEQKKRRDGDESGLIDKLMNEMEQGFELHGATAVEDRLQCGVPETLALLARGGVSVSVITGDKPDTAVNIGYSSRLLDEDTTVVASTSEALESAPSDASAPAAASASSGIVSPHGASLAAGSEGAIRAACEALCLVAIRNRSLGKLSAESKAALDEALPPDRVGVLDFAEGPFSAHRRLAVVLDEVVLDRMLGVKDKELVSSKADVTTGAGSTVLGERLAVLVSERLFPDPHAMEAQFSARASRRFRASGARGDRCCGGCCDSSPEAGRYAARYLPSAPAAESAGPLSGAARQVLEAVRRRRRAVLFAAIAASDASLCCRARPDQKAAVVRLVREGQRSAVTLAIGDGANDVDMIKAAHVGIGVAGAEGTQASNASDFSIARFRFLSPLLMAHGRWSLQRLAVLVMYLLYKNVVYGASLIAFGALSAWSGQRLFVTSVDQTYNLVFTGLPVLLTAVFDEDLPMEVLLRIPALYATGRGAPQLGAKSFAWWIVTGAVEGVLAFVVTWLTLGQSLVWMNAPMSAGNVTSALRGPESSSGSLQLATTGPLGEAGGSTQVMEFGYVVFTVVVAGVSARLASATHSHGVLFAVISLLSVACLLPAAFIVSALDESDLDGFQWHLLESPSMWLATFLVVVITLCYPACCAAVRRSWWPSLYDVTVESVHALRPGLAGMLCCNQEARELSRTESIVAIARESELLYKSLGPPLPGAVWSAPETKRGSVRTVSTHSQRDRRWPGSTVKQAAPRASIASPLLAEGRHGSVASSWAGALGPRARSSSDASSVVEMGVAKTRRESEIEYVPPPVEDVVPEAPSRPRRVTLSDTAGRPQAVLPRGLMRGGDTGSVHTGAAFASDPATEDFLAGHDE